MSRADSSTYTRGSPMYRTTATAITPQADVTQIILDSGDTLAWGDGSPGTADTVLVRAAANRMALRNGTTEQRLDITNTYTSDTNLELLSLYFTGNNAYIVSTTTGGTARNLALSGGTKLFLGTAGVDRWEVSSTGLSPQTNGAADIGTASLGLRKLYVDYTNTGAVGAVTINKASGRVNIAASGTSVVVTNSLVTAASHVMAWMSSADGTAGVTSVVPGAGSFTITCAAVTGQTSFDFFVVSAD